MKPPLFGCAIFDDSSAVGGGWACKAGGEPFLFLNRGDLHSDYIWITNIGAGDLKASGLGSLPNMRRKTYFGGAASLLEASFQQILADFSASSDRATMPESAKIMAEAIGECIRLASEAYGIKHWSKPSFYEEIRGALGLAPYKGFSQEIVRALIGAWQQDSAASPHWSSMTSDYIVRTNRVYHSRRLLEGMVPGGGWEYVDGEALSERILDRPDAILRKNRPALIRASVSFEGNTDPLALVAFGATTFSPRNAPPRMWLTDRELLLLIEKAEVKIYGAWFADRYEPLAEKLRLPSSVFSDILSCLSYSAGLMAENHIAALDTGFWQSNPKEGEPQTTFSPTAVWLKAADRVLTYPTAKVLADAGLRVKAYGRGAVVVWAEPWDVRTLMEVCVENGLSLPVGMAAAAVDFEKGDSVWASSTQ